MSPTNTLIRSMLRDAHRDPHLWTLQGFGMLRCYISETLRLHVWSPRHAVPGVTAIHTHPWDFTSRVLCGSITDTTYRSPSRWLPFTHITQRLQCGEGGGLVGMPRATRLITYQVNRYVSGDTYGHDAEDIHSIRPDPGTVTLCKRDFKEDRDHAHVFWPEGDKWVSAEPRPATIGEILDITRSALEILEV